MKKIVIIGPESTGKSTLSELLAKHYNTLWCPEYAREYLLAHGIHYTYDDLLTIAEGQVDLEDRYAEEVIGEKADVKRETTKVKSENLPADLLYNTPTSPVNQPILFIDTNMYVMKVWSEYVFNKCHPFILNQIEEREYSLYLLCDIDLPWEDDVLRENPDLESRAQLYAIYKNILVRQQTPWVEISGGYDERLQKAIGAVNKVLSI